MLPSIELQLINKKVKPTAMRLLVLEILYKDRNAVSLSDLVSKFERAEKSTLFRTLKTFEEKKIIHRIDDGTGSVKYALCADDCDDMHEDEHIHFVCTVCKNTICLNNIKIPSINLPNNFKLNDLQIIAKGICDKCNS
ncbi:transcriptional repressor [Carboxylicivirga mesophila]|uniref:Transcriptional repressor n=1 Tax=Carboxylicivirga mesophila TaxID=1166478 RepID=A0ABS5KC57_9BACT|nr:transcriptional repressor [Carboxylicivirga mesophila]MBS2212623.1 transcriptional repressor [Carboxylicivirga mesophila]